MLAVQETDPRGQAVCSLWRAGYGQNRDSTSRKELTMSWNAKRYRKKEGRNKHHLTPVCRGGPTEDWNLLLIRLERHQLLHKIFGVQTLDETIELLTRLRRLKNRQRLREVA
jgi:hypothetical protein